MKKLMIALGTAASMAWCANAAVESQVVSATDFNSLTEGTLSIVPEDVDGSYLEGGKYYWERATNATEISSTIKAKANGANDLYLAVDETVPLYRTMNGSVNTVDPAPGTSLADNGVYFSADVQFTASDETSGEGMVAEGDKLLVWLRATEAEEAVMNGDEIVTPAKPATTNLIITAASGKAGTPAADYIVAATGEHGVAIDPATWYKLTIKAVATGAAGLQTAAFTVELDDEQLYAATNGAPEASTTFNSLVGTGNDKLTITSVGFKGTGALDNLEFGTFTEDVVTFNMELSINAEAGVWPEGESQASSVFVGDAAYTNAITYTHGQVGNVDIIVAVDQSKSVTSPKGTFTYDADMGGYVMTLDLSDQLVDLLVDIAVTNGGTPSSNFPSGWNDGHTPDSTIVSKFGAWAEKYGVTASTATLAQQNAFLLNIDPAEGDQSFKVTSIVIEGGMVKITTSPASTGVNGKVYLYKGDSPTSLTKQADAIDGGDLTTIPYDTNKGEQFYKVEVGY